MFKFSVKSILSVGSAIALSVVSVVSLVQPVKAGVSIDQLAEGSCVQMINEGSLFHRVNGQIIITYPAGERLTVEAFRQRGETDRRITLDVVSRDGSRGRIWGAQVELCPFSGSR